MQYLFWHDLSDPNNVDLTNDWKRNALYNPSDHPIYDDGKLHSDVITLTIDQQTGTPWGNLFQGIRDWIDKIFGNGSGEQEEAEEARYPIFAFGMGSNVDENNQIYTPENHQSTMRYYGDIITNNNQDNNFPETHFIDSNEPSKTFKNYADQGRRYLFTGYNSTYQTFDPTGAGEDGWAQTLNLPGTHHAETQDNHKAQERGYFNSYFKVENDTKLYIRDFQITFTNRLGNTEDIIYKVDFVPNTNLGFDENSQTWNAWPDDSNVQIGFDMDKTDGGVNFRFYRDNSNNVYGYYDNANYKLVNSEYGNKATLVGPEV